MRWTLWETKIAALPGDVGIFYMDTASGEVFRHNAAMPLEAASVIKLPIMVEAFRQFETGLLDPENTIVLREEDKLPSCGALTYMHSGLQVTIRDLVTLMIILSDNTATNLLIGMLGQDRINACMDDLGLKGSRLHRMLFRPELSAMGIQNYVTAEDMGRLLLGLLRGELVSAQASQEMLQILGQQRLNGKMPFFLHDKGIRCAHKTGEDDGITHDVGILWTESPKIFCFLSNRTDVPGAERILQELAADAAGVSC